MKKKYMAMMLALNRSLQEVANSVYVILFYVGTFLFHEKERVNHGIC